MQGGHHVELLICTLEGHTGCVGKEEERAQHRRRCCRLGTRRADIDPLDDYRRSLCKRYACVRDALRVWYAGGPVAVLHDML